MSKIYDIVVLGCTGFTGTLVCKYLNKEYSGIKPLRWAIAGRDKKKMEALRLELSLPASVETLEIDLTSSLSIDSVISKSKVLLSTAGPFAKIGSPIVASCIRCGTHYCDITGEFPWVQKMISEHHDAALAKKLKIVHCCGFDCIPSDLGAQMMAEHLLNKHGDVVVEEIRLNVLDAKGEASGGTIASMMNIMESTPFSELLAMGNPYLLNPRDPVTKKIVLPPAASSGVLRASLDATLPYDSIAKIWTAPYFMEAINKPVVNRSNAMQGWRNGANFIYSERLRVPNLLVAALVSASMAVAGILLLLPPVRALLKLVLYKPGQGPSEDARNAGFFQMALWARAKDLSSGETILSRGSVEAFNGDPGYKQTAKMVAESALCLAFDDLPSAYGVLTPATAMGAALRQRLHAKGILFAVQEQYEIRLKKF